MFLTTESICVQKMHMPIYPDQTDLKWVYTICSDLPVRKLRKIISTFLNSCHHENLNPWLLVNSSMPCCHIRLKFIFAFSVQLQYSCVIELQTLFKENNWNTLITISYRSLSSILKSWQPEEQSLSKPWSKFSSRLSLYAHQGWQKQVPSW